MQNIVKNTTKFNLLDLICPHSCRGCGHLGAPLCPRCKNYIISQPKILCPICARTTASPETTCNCDSPFDKIFVVGWREPPFSTIIKDLKFHSIRACAPILAELLDSTIPADFSHSRPVVLVPLPTIGRHIRARGLDHTRIIAKQLTKLRDYTLDPLLIRATDTTQVGSSAAKRLTQAASTYTLRPRTKVSPDITYLLLDDIWTTGASMTSAAKILQSAGAKHISGAVLAISHPNIITE